MGTFEWPVQISTLDRRESREIQATVDTGATYTVLPCGLLNELGISPLRKAGFELGDGRIAELDIGEVRAMVNGVNAVTLVVFGGDDVQPLLGAYALEGLLLAVDPVNERLVPTHAIWY